MSARGALLIGLQVLVLLACLALALHIVATKVIAHAPRGRARRPPSPPHRAALLELAAGEDRGPACAAPRRSTGHRATRSTSRASTCWPRCAASRPTALVDVLEAHGAIERARADLHAPHDRPPGPRGAAPRALPRRATALTTSSRRSRDPAPEVRVQRRLRRVGRLGEPGCRGAPSSRAVGAGATRSRPASRPTPWSRWASASPLVLRAGLRGRAPRPAWSRRTSRRPEPSPALPDLLRLCLVGGPATHRPRGGGRGARPDGSEPPRSSCSLAGTSRRRSPASCAGPGVQALGDARVDARRADGARAACSADTRPAARRDRRHSAARGSGRSGARPLWTAPPTNAASRHRPLPLARPAGRSARELDGSVDGLRSASSGLADGRHVRPDPRLLHGHQPLLPRPHRAGRHRVPRAATGGCVRRSSRPSGEP